MALSAGHLFQYRFGPLFFDKKKKSLEARKCVSVGPLLSGRTLGGGMYKHTREWLPG